MKLDIINLLLYSVILQILSGCGFWIKDLR